MPHVPAEGRFCGLDRDRQLSKWNRWPVFGDQRDGLEPGSQSYGHVTEESNGTIGSAWRTDPSGGSAGNWRRTPSVGPPARAAPGPNRKLVRSNRAPRVALLGTASAVAREGATMPSRRAPLRRAEFRPHPRVIMASPSFSQTIAKALMWQLRNAALRPTRRVELGKNVCARSRTKSSAIAIATVRIGHVAPAAGFPRSASTSGCPPLSFGSTNAVEAVRRGAVTATRPTTTAATKATTRGAVRAGAQFPPSPMTATPTVPKTPSRYHVSHANTFAPSRGVFPGVSIIGEAVNRGRPRRRWRSAATSLRAAYTLTTRKPPRGGSPASHMEFGRGGSHDRESGGGRRRWGSIRSGRRHRSASNNLLLWQGRRVGAGEVWSRHAGGGGAWPPS